MEILSDSRMPGMFFNRCWFVDGAGRYSTDYLTLAKEQKKLTFNRKYLDPKFNDWVETPFEEIKLADPLLLDSDVDFAATQEFSGTYDDYLDLIIEDLKSVLLQLDPKEKYIMSHSSGTESRMISGVMRILKDEGRANFDNVLFHCWGRPEEKSFREIMNRNGFSNISIHDDTRPNAYDVGVSSRSVDGWNPYPSQMAFWGDIDPSQYIFLSGGDAASFQLPYQRWIHERAFFVERGEAVHRLAKTFKGVFFPFLSKQLLKSTFSMPNEWRNINDKRLARDKIRVDLVARLGLLDIPIENACYNFNFSDDRKRQMISLYEQSKFKREHHVEIDVDDLFKRPNGWNSRAWAFAVTVYEQLF